MVIDHPQNDGRQKYRKREIGEKVSAMRTTNGRPYSESDMLRVLCDCDQSCDTECHTNGRVKTLPYNKRDGIL